MAGGGSNGTTQPVTMLVVVAHPDDESFGCGSLIGSASAAGWRVVVCSATRGEGGECSDAATTDLGARRETELRRACAALQADEVELFGLADSGWAGEPPPDALVACEDRAREAARSALLRHRPSVVITLDPTGSDGHRDHAAIGRAVTDAFMDAVDWPASLYHWCLPRSLMARWALAMAGADSASVYLEQELGRPDDEITTIVDTTHVLDARRRAIAEHSSQTSPFAGLDDDLALAFLTRDYLVRVFPRWTGGPVEHALHVPPDH